MTSRRPRTSSTATAVTIPDDSETTSDAVETEDGSTAEPNMLIRTTRSKDDRTQIHMTFNRDDGSGVVSIEQNGHNLMAFTIPKEQPIKEPEIEGR